MMAKSKRKGSPPDYDGGDNKYDDKEDIIPVTDALQG
jgi:hypothetical protein